MTESLGRAVLALETDASGLQRGLGQAETQTQGWLGRISGSFKRLTSSSIGGALMQGIGLGAGLSAFQLLGSSIQGAVNYMGDGIQMASDLNEEISKSQVVFGSHAAELQRWGDTTADSLGLTKTEALGAAGAFGNMFNTVGLAQDKSADMSQTMVQLAADMASFNNEDPSEMLDKLRSGLSGEAEPLRRFGVLLSEATVSAFAYRTGIAETGVALTEAQKVQARYGLILEQTAIQQGDVARTSDSFANKQRRLDARMQEIQTRIGQGLIPIFQFLQEVLLVAVLPAIELLVGAFSVVGNVLDFITGPIQAVAEGFVKMAEDSEQEMASLKGAAEMHMPRAVEAMRSELEKGGPVIAAEAGKIAGMLPSEIQARVDEIRAAGSANIVAFAAGMLEKQNDPLLAMEAMLKAQETALTRQEEITRLQGALQSEALAAGLTDGRREVRLAAHAARLVIIERLETLGVNASTWGYNIGAGIAGGMNAAQYLVKGAAKGLASATGQQIKIESEPPDPDSPLRGITRWGGNIVRTLAEDMHRTLGVGRGAGAALARALTPRFDVPAFAMAGGSSAGLAGVGGTSTTTTIQYILNVDGAPMVMGSRDDVLNGWETLARFGGSQP